MRILGFLMIIAVIYILFFRTKPAPPQTEMDHPAPVAAAAPPVPPHRDVLMQPFDRTHEVLDLAKKRASDQP